MQFSKFRGKKKPLVRFSKSVSSVLGSRTLVSGGAGGEAFLLGSPAWCVMGHAGHGSRALGHMLSVGSVAIRSLTLHNLRFPSFTENLDVFPTQCHFSNVHSLNPYGLEAAYLPKGRRKLQLGVEAKISLKSRVTSAIQCWKQELAGGGKYIYIYILCIYICIYIYTHTHKTVCVYIYTHTYKTVYI